MKDQTLLYGHLVISIHQGIRSYSVGYMLV